jgi:hypothetical protein
VGEQILEDIIGGFSVKVKFSFTPIMVEFDSIGVFKEGLAFVRTNWDENKAGFIDQSGEVAIPLDYHGKSNNCIVWGGFNEGLAALIKEGKVGFVDRTGKVAIPFEYDGATIFSEGLAAVGKDGKWGFINHKGEVVVPLEYDMVFNFHEGIAPVRKNGKSGYINKTGEIVIPLEYDIEDGYPSGFSEGLTLVEKNEKKGFIDKMGKVIIPIELEYEHIGSFEEGIAAVTTEKYKSVERFKNESDKDFFKRAEEVRKHQRWGFIDKTGKIVIPIEYAGHAGHMPLFIEGLAVVIKDGKQSYIDPTGNHPFPTDFDELSPFQGGLASVKKGDKYAFIDKTGKVVILLENDYDYVSSFSREGYASVTKDGKYGFIDKTGNIIVPLEYDSATTRFNEGLSVVKKDGKWGIFQIETEE